MRSLGWDAGLILDTVSSVLSSKNHGSTAAVNELLAELTLQVDRDLLDGVLALLPTLAVRPNLQSYEVLLDAHLYLDNFHEVKSLTARLRQAGTRLTPAMLRAGQLADFRAAVRELRAAGAEAAWTDAEVA